MSKKAGNIDLDALLEAIKEVKINGKSIRSVASQYNIPKSNLSRYISNLTANNVDFATADANDIKNMIAPMVTYGPKTYFTAEQEMELMKYVLFASNIHYGLSIVELKTLAYQYAKKIGIEYPAEWDTNGHAGKHWYYLFMKRHPNLSLRKPQQVSANRSKAFNKENVDGRKPMKAAILTSPEVVADLREKADAKRKKIEQQKEKRTKKGPPAKKNKPSARPTRQAKRAARPTRDVDFCILCFDDMPERMTAQNTAKCIECQREVHLRCVYASPNTFKCPNCESDGE